MQVYVPQSLPSGMKDDKENNQFKKFDMVHVHCQPSKEMFKLHNHVEFQSPNQIFNSKEEGHEAHLKWWEHLASYIQSGGGKARGEHKKNNFFK